jgi:hypothetical protein
MGAERIFPQDLSVISDYQDAKWIQDALNSYQDSGNWGLGVVIPVGFESYISIRRSDSGDDKNYANSQEDCAEDLNSILGSFTSPDESCLVAMWNGFGWSFEDEYSSLYSSKRSTGNGFYTSENNFVPFFKTPFREYYVLKCPLSETSKFGCYEWENFLREPANIYWPESRNWFVANEIDHDVTLIGGDEELISEIENSGKFITERFDPRVQGCAIYLAPAVDFSASESSWRRLLRIFRERTKKLNLKQS